MRINLSITGEQKEFEINRSTHQFMMTEKPEYRELDQMIQLLDATYHEMKIGLMAQRKAAWDEGR